jgi:peroxiredoxin
MKKTVWLGLTVLLLTACDSGQDANDNPASHRQERQPPQQTQTVGCTKTAHCDWGEWCVNKQCAAPGDALGLAPDFTTTDLCPESQTYQQDISLSDNQGKVTLLYFATTTCAACVADVKVYESMIKQLEYKGFTNAATMITVILPYGGSDMAGFTAGIQYPVVLDEDGLGIAAAYGASKDTVVLLDAAGYERANWPTLEVRGNTPKDKTVLNDALVELVQEIM